MIEPPGTTGYTRHPDSPPRANSWMRCGASFALLAMAVISCTCAGVQVLAEGPHGPHGQITNDPSIVWMLPLSCGLGIILAGLAIWLFAYSMGWRRKR
jgi:hypothetical protein